MSNTKILAKAEYTFLGLSALGTVLATTTGKIAFATSPFMVTLFLNLINRKELAQRSSKNSQKITLVDKELTNNNHSFQEEVKKIDRSLIKNNNDNEYIKHEYQQEFIKVRREIEVLQSSLTEVNNISWLDEINREIDFINQKVHELTQEGNNKQLLDNQEIALQNKKMREDISSLSLSLNKKIDDFLSNLDSLVTYEDLNKKISKLFPDNRLNLDEILKAARLQSDAQLEPAREAYKDIRDNYLKLQESYSKLNQAYQDNLSKTENYVTSEELKQVQKDISDNLSHSINEYNLNINNNRPQYKLVYDRRGSRDVLLKALKEAQERIILVCPWITYYGADDEVIRLCQAFLERGGSLDIGWGHLKDIKQTKHIPISRDEFIITVKNNNNDWVYSQVRKFIELEENYQRCNLKLLGTHEKFLVCDRSFAMIGSHNFLTSNCHSSERELGLITNDKNMIEDLINRFETAPSLDNLESINHQQTTRQIPTRRINHPILKTQLH